MKIAFNRQIRRSPWGGGAHFASAFADYLIAHNHDVVHQLESDVDWIIMLDPRHETNGFSVNEIFNFKRQYPNVKILHRINDTGVTRGGEELDHMLLMSNNAVANCTVFISEWVRNHFVSKGFDSNKPHSVIHNGCNTEFFYSHHVGYAHMPLRLVTHHWSDNPAKGLDVYRYIDEQAAELNIEFTYVGRYPKEYTPKYTRIISPLYGKALGDELRKHDVYVTGAKYEACGSHHVEGAACGMPVLFHKNGGGVVEMASRYGVGISNVEELPEALQQIKHDYFAIARKINSIDFSAKSMCAKYMELMK